MKEYAEYTAGLQLLAQVLAANPLDASLRPAVHAALNGQPNAELRKMVSLDARRADGVFFTGSETARRVVQSLVPRLAGDGVVLDPACGAGDLLLACAANMPTADSLSETLRLWGERLWGFDIHPEFVATARSRLVLAAILRCGGQHDDSLPLDVNAALPNLRVADALAEVDGYSRADVVVMNPPFSKHPASERNHWAGGTTNAAASFLVHCLEKVRVGTHVAAVLPEVLRCGTRYARWRDHVASIFAIHDVEWLGQFDRHADVDVFVIGGVADTAHEPDPSAWRKLSEDAVRAIGHNFAVSVGAVVPFRHPEDGTSRPYIFPELCPPFGTLVAGEHRRCFSGTCAQPPFVVVRRTSRPGEQYRAVPTLVTGQEPVAVENHLLVLVPTSDSMETCKRVLINCRDHRTTAWLDQTMRCRHLTVTAIRELPWWRKDRE